MRNIILYVLLLGVAFSTSAQIQVESTGNVQIGETGNVANRALEVRSSASTTRLLMLNSAATPNGGMEFYSANAFKGGFLLDGANNVMSFYGPAGSGSMLDMTGGGALTLRDGVGNQHMQIGWTGDGDIRIFGTPYKDAGGAWIGASDRRSKKNIQSLDLGLKEILRIKPVTYQYNGKFGTKDNGDVHVGVIAQEIQKVLPGMVKELVYEQNTANPNALIDDSSTVKVKKAKKEEYLGVDPSMLPYVLINAIQEQQEIIDEMKNQIEELNVALESFQGEFQNVKIEDNNLSGVSLSKVDQNSPNPFEANTNISYQIAEDVNQAELIISDIEGRVLKVVNINERGAGSIGIDMEGLSSGMYTYQLVADGKTVSTKKMVKK